MTQYAQITDLDNVGVKADVTAGIPDADLNAVLTKRSVFADGYLAAAGYVLPISAWGDDLRLAVAQLAAWDVMTTLIGINPETPGGAVWMTRRDEAMSWLRDVAAQKIVPTGIVDATPDVSEGGLVCYTSEPRGW